MSPHLTPLQIEQLNNFLIDLLSYRQQILATMPAELARLRNQLDKAHLGDIIVDPALFFRISLIVLFQREGPVSMGELSKVLEVPLSTATRIVDGLVENGLAERMVDPEDRRVVRVTLTQQGLDLHQVLNAFIQQHIERILSRFTPEECDQLIYLLGKVGVAFQENT